MVAVAGRGAMTYGRGNGGAWSFVVRSVGMSRPLGTVTFLLTDIEGSTRRWERDAVEMGRALAVHDEVLREEVMTHGGWVFKHTGDGVCAAFSVAGDAIGAAVDAQRRLRLPVRMGIATGSVELRGDDYFGPALNRAARVMAAGHGGQILVAAATAALASEVALVDLSVHRLRDLSGAENIFQVQAEGLRAEFASLRTLDATTGNVPAASSSFVGRDVEVTQLIELVRAHRLVTLTGVGGVGKTRLALQIAATLNGEFADGAWFVELAPIVDAAAVPGAVAAALGMTLRHESSFSVSVAQALSERRLLVVLDNCEHVLEAAADAIDVLLGASATVHVLATSREGLRVPAERLWPVPSLATRSGIDSPAVALFIARARAVDPTFELRDKTDAAAVIEVCERLDGIALAIELAAARIVAMSARDVRDLLGDRFRLLTGARRGLERHQTLRHAVDWSYDLLEPAERSLLAHCAVFTGGFDLRAATAVLAERDEFAALDGLESLVRKSLVTVDRSGGHARYGMLETIRQYAEDKLVAAGGSVVVRDRHAAYYAQQAVAYWALWDGPLQRDALDWVDCEFDNLRAGFRWAADREDVTVAAAIAAHATMLAFGLQRYEPIDWAEELLPTATAADISQLPRLYAAASHCSYTYRPRDGFDYACRELALETDQRYEPFENGWNRYWAVAASVFTGNWDTALAICGELVTEGGSAHVQGRCGQTLVLALSGRPDEAVTLVDETVAAARLHGNPWLIAHALNVAGFAHEPNNPPRALEFFHQAHTFAVDGGSPFWEAEAGRQVARLETSNGDVDRGLELYNRVIESYQRAGNTIALALTLRDLASCLLHLQSADAAAVLIGATRGHAMAQMTEGTKLMLRDALRDAEIESGLAQGAAMDLAQAAAFARQETETARRSRQQPGWSSADSHDPEGPASDTPSSPQPIDAPASQGQPARPPALRMSRHPN